MKFVVMCLLLAGTACVCLASQASAAERTIKVEFDAPATNYLVRIQEVYRLADELWVISKVMLDPNDEIGGDTITRVSEQITVEADEDLTVVHWIVGKDWNWGEDTKSLRYVADPAHVQAKLKEQMGVRIWQRPAGMDPEPEPTVELGFIDGLRILFSTMRAMEAMDD
mgnify:CR=1 FL=1